MPLKHKLGVAGARIPELDAAVLRSGKDPGGVGGQGNAENEVLGKQK